jgi:hypothetical protein
MKSEDRRPKGDRKTADSPQKGTKGAKQQVNFVILALFVLFRGQFCDWLPKAENEHFADGRRKSLTQWTPRPRRVDLLKRWDRGSQCACEVGGSNLSVTERN